MAVEVASLARAVTGGVGRLGPHVTLVPPVNVADDEVAAALAVLRAAAGGAVPVRVELGPPSLFEGPDRSVVHLPVAAGAAQLGALAEAASRGPLAPPGGRPERPYVPHVTLGRLPPGRASVVADALGSWRAVAVVASVQLLAEVVDGAGRRWAAQADELLGGRAIRQRGGLELELQLGRRLDPEAAGALGRAVAAGWGVASLDARSPFAVVARRSGTVVGAATGERRGAAAWCTCLVVVPSERRLGAGGRLVEAVERGGAGDGVTVVRHVVPAGSDLSALLHRRGYRRVGSLPGPPGGRAAEVLERRLGGGD